MYDKKFEPKSPLHKDHQEFLQNVKNQDIEYTVAYTPTDILSSMRTLLPGINRNCAFEMIRCKAEPLRNDKK